MVGQVDKEENVAVFGLVKFPAKSLVDSADKDEPLKITDGMCSRTIELFYGDRCYEQICPVCATSGRCLAVSFRKQAKEQVPS